MNSQEHSPSGTPQAANNGEAAQDLSSTHVTHVREDVAMAGRCANVHLPTGRTCALPVRHRGACDFVRPEEAESIAVH